MSYGVDREVADSFKDPSKAREALRKHFVEMDELVDSPNLYKGNGDEFFKTMRPFSKYAIEPSHVQFSPMEPQVLPFNSGIAMSQQQFNPQFNPQLKPPRIQPGYPAVIVLSIAFLSVAFLAYTSIISPDIAILFGLGALFLYFLPPILERITHLAGKDVLNPATPTIVADLFKEASDRFVITLLMSRVVTTEGKGKVEEDTVAHTQLNTRAFLHNNFRKIFNISEREWTLRMSMKENNAIRMVSGSSGTPNSDVVG